MCHLHDALHAQLHSKSTNDDLDGSTRRKRLRRFHVAAAGADVAKHTAIRYGASLAENICSETAGMAGLRQPALRLYCQSALAKSEQRGRHIPRIGVGDGGLRVQANP